MSLRFQSVVDGPLWLDQHFEVGITALVGHAGDELDRVLELATGYRRPVRGVVSLDSVPLFDAPRARASIGSALGDEWAPPRWRTSDWIRQLRRLHGLADGDPSACLARLGLEALGHRFTESLSVRERRSVTLAVALSLPSPRALVLEDPLGLGIPEQSRLIELLGAAGARAIVLLTTPHHEDAALLGARPLVFAKGRCLPAPTQPSGCFRVTTDRPGALAAALLADPRVYRVHAPVHTGTLEVSGHDPKDVSRAILEGAAATHAMIENLVEAQLDLDVLQATWRGYADAAYTAAHQVASQVYVAPTPARPDDPGGPTHG